VKISVITAVYNNCTTIVDALESALCQSYSDVDLVVIDGGSTDGTLEILYQYSDRLGKLVSGPDSGIYDALNKGIYYSKGDVIGFLHSDDVFENKEVLSKVAAAFRDPNVDAIYGDLVYVRNDDIGGVVRYWKSGTYDKLALSRGWMPPHPTFYVRRAVYERLGGFDTQYLIAADYDLILRFLAVGKIHAFYIPEVLVRMRLGGISNRSLRVMLHKSYEDLCVLRRNHVGGFLALLRKNLSKLPQFWRALLI